MPQDSVKIDGRHAANIVGMGGGREIWSVYDIPFSHWGMSTCQPVLRSSRDLVDVLKMRGLIEMGPNCVPEN